MGVKYLFHWLRVFSILWTNSIVSIVPHLGPKVRFIGTEVSYMIRQRDVTDYVLLYQPKRVLYLCQLRVRVLCLCQLRVRVQPHWWTNQFPRDPTYFDPVRRTTNPRFPLPRVRETGYCDVWNDILGNVREQDGNRNTVHHLGESQHFKSVPLVSVFTPILSP